MISFQIGGIGFSVTVSTPDSLEGIGDFSSRCGVVHSDEPLFQLELRDPIPKFPEELPTADVCFIPQPDNTYLLAYKRQFVATVDPVKRKAWLSPVTYEDYPFDDLFYSLALNSLVRAVLTLILPEKGGFLLHGGSVAIDDRAVVFCGVSGAGKSTLCEMAGNRPVFTDEMTLVVPDSDGLFQVHPSPFFGLFTPETLAQEPLPLGGLLLIDQDKEDRIVPFDPITKAYPRFFRCIMSLHETKHIAQLQFDNTTRLFDATPPANLRFRREPDVWKTIERYIRERSDPNGKI